MAKSITAFILAVALSFIGLVPLFHSGLHPTHDGEYHVIRFYEFDQVLRSGVFYPRWAPDLNNGFGVPLFNFVYPLPNYVASFFHMFGQSFIDAFKMNMAVATFLGAVFMYLWAKEFWGRLGGVVSSVLYSFAPYRFVDIYVRGSVGEVWAMAFAPLVLWSITKTIRSNDLRFAPLISLSISFLIFSHNILALLFCGFSLIYTLFLIKQQKFRSTKYLAASFLLGLGLSGIFWIPALIEKQYVVGLEVFSVEEHFVELYQLLIPSWGTGFSQDLGSGISFQIGVINSLAILVSIVALIVARKNKSRNKIIIFFLLSFAVLIFLMLPVSKSVWSMLPLLKFFQFPWRLLSLVVLIAAFLGGVFSFGRLRYGISAFIIFAAIALTYSYTKPAYYHDRNDQYYISRPNFIYGTNSPGNAFNTIWFSSTNERRNLAELETGELREVSIRPQSYVFDVKTTETSRLILNTAYFPGWKAFKSDEPMSLDRTEDGRISTVLPAGEYRLNVVFTDTITRQVGFWVSALSFLGLGFFVWKLSYENRNR